jgi:hypothetical protein
MRKNRWIVTLAVALTLVSASAFAQAPTTSLSGTVVDNTNGVLPGAVVVVKSNATGVSQQQVTNTAGRYSFPSLDVGTYTVTISMQGFKKAEYTGDGAIRLLAGTPGELKTTLEVGGMTETVQVKGTTDLVRTQSPTVSTTVSTEFISSLPRSDRNALSFLIFLPGVQTSGGSQNSRNSTIAGLPQNTIEISIDGVNTGNNLQSGDGFFTLVTPRLDSTEEVTMSQSGVGADASGAGTVQIQFVTRSGTNKFNTSLYEYFKHNMLNSNTFGNRVQGLPKPRATVDTYGGRIGGPIWIPGLFDGHGKAFFFFNQEEIWQPSQIGRTRTVATTAAMNGNFTFNNSSPRTVNVLQLAAANGQISTADPLVMYVLNAIKAVESTTGTVQTSATTPNTEAYAYQLNLASKRHSPTGRVDINLSSRNRLSGTYYWQRLVDTPDTLNSADPTFPGFPTQAGQTSYRTTGSSTLRTTLGNNLVNEVLVGWQSSPVSFFADSSAAMFTDPKMDTKGYFLNLGFGLTGPATSRANGPEIRNTVNLNINDNLNWLRGNHSIKLGFQYTRLWNTQDDWTNVPSVNLGLSTNNTFDPALAMFTTTNFPTATPTDLNNARALYGLLTGRVSQIPGTAYLSPDGSTYIYNGHQFQKERQDVISGYATDSWRWKPNVTLTGGLRYEVQLPMVGLAGLLDASTMTDACGISGLGNGAQGRQCNLFTNGFTYANPSFPGANFYKLSPSTKGYNLDLNNLAPDAGVNWRPNVKSGVLRKILGDPEQATVSGSWARTYNRPRFDQFQTVYIGNPGGNTPAARGFSSSQFCLICGSASNPLLLSPGIAQNLLTPPAFVQTPTFPLSVGTGDSLWLFDPNIQIPYTDSWTVGLQRAISRDTVVEARYVGNKNKAPWASENWNGANFRETGLVGTNVEDNTPNQFAAAQANLLANVAAGRGGSFAYFGPGTGTTPLPLFLAHFSAQPIASAGNAALYTSTQWTNTTWVGALNPFAPSPSSIASNLWTGSNGLWATNAITSGIYPKNFWVMNPAVSPSVNVTRNLGSSKYNALQIDLRRRFSHGLQFQASYTYARQSGFSNFDLHLPLLEQRNGIQGVNSSGSQVVVPHAVKMLWTWQLPVGRGARYGTNMNKWLDGVIGGWSFSGTGRMQIPVFRLSNTLLVGMSHAEAQAFFKQIRINTDTNGNITVWDMPTVVVNSTIQAYSTSGALAGYYTQGVPQGAYFAPASHPAGLYGASDPGCMGLFPRDCAPDMFFYGKWFGEFDIRLTKQFHITKRVTADMSAEVFNVLRGLNFFQAMNPGSGSTIFGINTNTIGSAARTGQLSWRVTW